MTALRTPEQRREQALELIDEGLEILTGIIDNIKRRGNYSPESTCVFIDQGASAIREARGVIDGGSNAS